MDIKMASLVIIAGMLFGCGGATSSTSGSTPRGPNQEVTSLDIAGTSADVAGITPINPAENLGRFSVTWKVRDSRTLYRSALAVSLDNVASAGDRVFFFRNCGSLNDACPSADSTTIDCSMTNENVISCTGDDDQADLTTFFDALPKDAYIIIETCLITDFDCYTQSHPVQFQ